MNGTPCPVSSHLRGVLKVQCDQGRQQSIGRKDLTALQEENAWLKSVYMNPVGGLRFSSVKLAAVFRTTYPEMFS